MGKPVKTITQIDTKTIIGSLRKTWNTSPTIIIIIIAQSENANLPTTTVGIVGYNFIFGS
jgi:hypothetical protein